MRDPFRDLASSGQLPGITKQVGRRNKMTMTDPLGDMLTRIRNGLTAKNH